MIKFIDKDGVLFNGSSPYVHWVNGQQSTNLVYPLKLMIVTDENSELNVNIQENDVFKLIDPNLLQDGEDLKNIVSNKVTYIPSGYNQFNNLYIYQILLIASSETAGQITEHLSITIGDEIYDVIVGGDFYDLNEILEINLENRGLELPVTIQKAIFESDIHNDITDNILINRKFKELISNYLDIVDCKGSYKSLYNSLQWFEWGDYAKLYEIWETDKDRYLEKDMELILSEIYESLLTSARKTTHISLVAALNRTLTGNDIPGFNSMTHDEKVKALFDGIEYGDNNWYATEPKIKDIEYQWSKNDLYLKVVILGAFFERFFMPIHLDLKRATMEALVYTPSINMGSGTLYRTSNFSYDTGIVDIEMDHVVTLGNIDGYAVGPYTMFGIKDMSKIDPATQSIEPIGVQPISEVSSTLPATLEGLEWDPIVGPEYEESLLQWNIDKSNPSDNIGWEGASSDYKTHDDVRITYSQFGGNVGVIVPIKVTIDLPNDDIIHRAEIYVYRGSDIESMPTLPSQYTVEKGVWKSIDGKVNINFNLLSLKEEIVSFTLVFYSLSGHIWTACSSYESIDVSGSYLNIYRVENTDNIPGSAGKIYDSVSGENGWLHGKPYSIQYNTIDVNNIEEDDKWILGTNATSIYGNLVQYIPTSNYKQLNEVFLVENTGTSAEYNTDWVNIYQNSNGQTINQFFWVFPRGEIDSYGHNKYYIIISKNPADPSLISDNEPYRFFGSKSNFVKFINNEFGGVLNITQVKRYDYAFIPQLHQYNNIEDLELKKNEYTERYEIKGSVYEIKRGTLLSIIPQFKRTVLMDQDSIKWEFSNVSKPGTVIEYKQPVSTIMIADNVYKDLDPGYWTITMYYKMVGSNEEHKLTKNSAFKIID